MSAPSIRSVRLSDFQVCPICRSVDGHYNIARSRWGYCKTHKTKWLTGWDDIKDEATAEQERIYDELGVGRFKHVYREEVEALAEGLPEAR
jgi:hypothetical protein